MATDLIEKRTAMARFPVLTPLRCPLDGGPMELKSPDSIQCATCGATQAKINRAMERMLCVVRPGGEDVLKAAKRIKKLFPEYYGVGWDTVAPERRRIFIESVRVVVQALKESVE